MRTSVPDVALNIARMSLRRLRAAVQHNQVSFPSQIPIFECQSRADIQWRVVELYFVLNWTCVELGRRYGVTMERVRQLLSTWSQRAIVLGYLQEIPAAAGAIADTEQPTVTFSVSAEPARVRAAASDHSITLVPHQLQTPLQL